jgi:hypothetical protein
MYVLGAKTPYDYFQKLKLYSMKRISHRVRQDFLLITGTHDHFVPLSHFHKQSQKLKNVRSFTGRIFTRYEQAENHVGFGNVPLVVNVMINWIKMITREVQKDALSDQQSQLPEATNSEAEMESVFKNKTGHHQEELN